MSEESATRLFMGESRVLRVFAGGGDGGDDSSLACRAADVAADADVDAAEVEVAADADEAAVADIEVGDVEAVVTTAGPALLLDSSTLVAVVVVLLVLMGAFLLLVTGRARSWSLTWRACFMRRRPGSARQPSM
jgi:hypothetical protein